MNLIVSMMANGAKREFGGAELRQIKAEANGRFRQLTEENREFPKALRQQQPSTRFSPAHWAERSSS